MKIGGENFILGKLGNVRVNEQDVIQVVVSHQILLDAVGWSKFNVNLRWLLHFGLQDNGDDTFSWLNVRDAYTCKISNSKKESKFGGLKSFIAYQLTPSVSTHEKRLMLPKSCQKLDFFVVEQSGKDYWDFQICICNLLNLFLYFQFNNIQVSRRYKHFDWLHERLVEKYSMIPIPPLPDKAIHGKEKFCTFLVNIVCLCLVFAQSTTRFFLPPLLMYYFKCIQHEMTW